MTLFAAMRGGATSPPNSRSAIATQIESKPTTIPETNQPIPHCVPSGSFSVLAVGESFYRDEIAIIAGNSSGCMALVYCTATLFLDYGNPHDSGAVAVLIEGRKVGHLCRDDAFRYRNGLDRAGHRYARTTCNALLRGGLVTQDRQYDYSVELDFLRDSPLDLDRTVVPTHPRPVRADSGISIVYRSPEEIVIRFPYISQDLTGGCQECAPIDTWTNPDGDSLHFFCQGSVGGPGRLGVLSKK